MNYSMNSAGAGCPPPYLLVSSSSIAWWGGWNGDSDSAQKLVGNVTGGEGKGENWLRVRHSDSEDSETKSNLALLLRQRIFSDRRL